MYVYVQKVYRFNTFFCLIWTMFNVYVDTTLTCAFAHHSQTNLSSQSLCTSGTNYLYPHFAECACVAYVLRVVTPNANERTRSYVSEKLNRSTIYRRAWQHKCSLAHDRPIHVHTWHSPAAMTSTSTVPDWCCCSSWHWPCWLRREQTSVRSRCWRCWLVCGCCLRCVRSRAVTSFSLANYRAAN